MAIVWYEAANDEASEACWELYHENSKRERRAGGIPVMSLPVREPDFSALPSYGLGPADALPAAFGATMLAPPEPMRAGRLPLRALAALFAYGAADAPGPVELYLAATSVADLPAGLYRHDALRKTLQLIRRGDFSSRIADMAADPAIARNSALQFFMVGAFDRAVAAEGERGYRSALIAAGALARQLALVATALGLGRATCDLHDREIDALLALDGLSRSVVHMLAVGAAAK